MEVCYLGVMYPDKFDYYEKNINNMFLQTSTARFCKNEISGLEANYKKEIFVINVSWLPYFPKYPLKVVKHASWNHGCISEDIEIGYRNIPILKTIDQCHNIVRELKKWINNKKDEKHVIYACTITVSILRALYIIKKKFPQVKICLTIVDLPGELSLDKHTGLKKIFRNIVAKIDKKEIQTFDAFVVLTKDMAKALDIIEKPYTVVEGFADASVLYSNTDNQRKKNSVLMAGWLNYDVDIMPLVKTFTRNSMKNYELWLAGGGDAVDEIKYYCDKYKNIKYFGFLPPEKILELQNNVDILINSRRNEHDYVKYSFPGKTFECLASGRPFISYKLDCYANEYDEYIFYIDEDDSNGIENKIKEVCSLSEEEKTSFGDKARKWILSAKSPIAQCYRIFSMMENV